MNGIIGIIRRIAGTFGVVLVALGVATQEEGAALSGNIELIIGAVLTLADLGPSLFMKLKATLGGLFGSDAK